MLARQVNLFAVSNRLKHRLMSQFPATRPCILLAAFIIMMIRVGMQVYRNSSSWRGWAGAAIFGSGLFLGYATVMAGFGH